MRFTITLIVLGLVAGGLLASRPLRGDDEKKIEKNGVKEEKDDDDDDKDEKKGKKEDDDDDKDDKKPAKNAEGEESIDPKKLPDGILKAAMKAFPDADVVGAAREKDGDKTVYEVELKQKGLTIDIMFSDKGVMELVEKQIPLKSVPEAISAAVSKKYPKSTIKLAEVLYKVADGKQTLDMYEVLIVTADENGVEIKLTPKGEIKEEEQKGKKGEKEDEDDDKADKKKDTKDKDDDDDDDKEVKKAPKKEDK